MPTRAVAQHTAAACACGREVLREVLPPFPSMYVDSHCFTLLERLSRTDNACQPGPTAGHTACACEVCDAVRAAPVRVTVALILFHTSRETELR